MRRMNWLPAAAVATIVLLALVVPFLGLPDPVQIDVSQRLAPPSPSHPLGQDEYGRDVLSRLLWGARVSLAVAFAAAALACLVGTALGLAGGFLRGLAEVLAIRSMDVVLCFPPLLLALLVVTLLGPGAATLIPVLALVYLPGFVRVVYAGVLSVRAQDYVEAQRALGAGPLRIMLRTILPNVGGPILVQFSLAAASAVVLESGLSFLGLGVVPPAPSWGLMIGAARATMGQAPLLLLWPCLALSLTILAMNALCDALRDAVDPQRRPRGPVHRRLLQALAPGLAPEPGPVLDLRGLTIEIETPSGPVRPVRDVSLKVEGGETLAIVGESGSGKSLTGLAVMGLLPPVARVVAGAAWLDGQEVLRLEEAKLRRLRGGTMAMIFQDPLSSLNPVHRVGSQIAEAVQAHRTGVCGGRMETGAGAPEEGGDSRSSEARTRLPARDVGRHAPARHDRDGDRQQPSTSDRRRADDGAGRHDPGTGARTPGRSEARARHGADLHHAQPARRGGDRRPGRRDVCG